MDPAWWHYTNAVISRMHEDDLVSLDRSSLDHYHTLSLLPLLPEGVPEAKEIRQKLLAAADDALQSIYNTLQPWAAKSVKQAQEDELSKLIGRYRAEVGDPRDPAFRAKMEADIAASREQRRLAREASAEDDDQIIARRIRERDHRGRNVRN